MDGDQNLPILRVLVPNSSFLLEQILSSLYPSKRTSRQFIIAVLALNKDAISVVQLIHSRSLGWWSDQCSAVTLLVIAALGHRIPRTNASFTSDAKPERTASTSSSQPKGWSEPGSPAKPDHSVIVSKQKGCCFKGYDLSYPDGRLTEPGRGCGHAGLGLEVAN